MTLATPTPVLDDAAEKALRLPVGVTSPLWMMIGGAAMMGAAMFWATRWLRPTNLEALLPPPATPAEPEVDTVTQEAVAAVEEIADTVVETMAVFAGAVVETVPEMVIVVDPVIEAPVLVAAEPEVEIAPEAVAEPDDLTVLTGIGPKLAALLAARGVTRFSQIAAWSEADIATLDKDMKLMGRIGREAWVAQAKRLAAG